MKHEGLFSFYFFLSDAEMVGPDLFVISVSGTPDANTVPAKTPGNATATTVGAVSSATRT